MFPLDVSSIEEAEALVVLLSKDIGVFKVGLELFTKAGPAAVELVSRHGAKCFLDLKLHDISETVLKAVDSAISLEVDFLTVHAANGPRTLERIATRAASAKLQLLAVTVLTSFDDTELAAIGVQKNVNDQVLSLGRMAINTGIAGLVASPRECQTLRAELGENFALMIPGVRPNGTAANDQKRIATPGEAIRNGATYLVVGRPIRDAANPREAAQQIVKEIDDASREAF